MAKYFTALKNLVPTGTGFGVEDNTFDGVKWSTGEDGGWTDVWPDDMPTREAVETEYQRLVEQEPWDNLRIERDRLLTETDWWASADRTMTAEQTAYRQALRDLPANTTDPNNPVWPVKP
jgi:hypothetical protein